MAKKQRSQAETGIDEITGKPERKGRGLDSLVFGRDLERMGDWMVELGQRLKECGRAVTKKYGEEKGQRLARMAKAREGLRAIRDAILASSTKLADDEFVDASKPEWKTAPRMTWLPS